MFTDFATCNLGRLGSLKVKKGGGQSCRYKSTPSMNQPASPPSAKAKKCPPSAGTLRLSRHQHCLTRTMKKRSTDHFRNVMVDVFFFFFIGLCFRLQNNLKVPVQKRFFVGLAAQTGWPPGAAMTSRKTELTWSCWLGLLVRNNRVQRIGLPLRVSTFRNTPSIQRPEWLQ